MVASDYYRGIIHFHSSSSFDSITRIDTIVSTARNEKLDFIVLTDHDTIRGSQLLHQRISQLGLDIVVPIAAEYRTSLGDVIAVFLEREIVARDFDEFRAEARQQGAVLLLPHPYGGHKEIDYLAQNVDLIEIFNGRIKPNRNTQARVLAEHHHKLVYYASDAHLSSHIANVIVSVERMGDLRESLLSGTIQVVRETPLPRSDVILSQMIKMIRTRDFQLFKASLLRLFGKATKRFLIL